MAPSATNGDAVVGSDGPRQKGKATPDTLTYVYIFSAAALPFLLFPNHFVFSRLTADG